MYNKDMDIINLADLEGDASEVSVQVSDTDLVLYFPYHPDAVKQIKRIEGAEYQPHDKAWALPVTDENKGQVYDTVAGLREFFEREADKALLRIEYQQDIGEHVIESLKADFDHPDLGLELRGSSILVRFPYDQKSMKAIKKVDERVWDGMEKAWKVPTDADKSLRKALRGIMKQLD